MQVETERMFVRHLTQVVFLPSGHAARASEIGNGQIGVTNQHKI